MPAPNPSARASAEAVDHPSRIADSTSTMPGPSSTTSTSSCPSLTAASSRPPTSAWMTTFISASYAAIIARRTASLSAPMRLRCCLRSRDAAPALMKSPQRMS